MAYYILAEGFELCGWKGLPFALRYPNPYLSDFFDKEEYRVVYALDGKHDIDEKELTEKQKETSRPAYRDKNCRPERRNRKPGAMAGIQEFSGHVQKQRAVVHYGKMQLQMSSLLHVCS